MGVTTPSADYAGASQNASGALGCVFTTATQWVLMHVPLPPLPLTPGWDDAGVASLPI